MVRNISNRHITVLQTDDRLETEKGRRRATDSRCCATLTMTMAATRREEDRGVWVARGCPQQRRTLGRKPAGIRRVAGMANMLRSRWTRRSDRCWRSCAVADRAAAAGAAGQGVVDGGRGQANERIACERNRAVLAGSTFLMIGVASVVVLGRRNKCIPIYAVDRGKRRGKHTYYYLVESARVTGSRGSCRRSIGFRGGGHGEAGRGRRWNRCAASTNGSGTGGGVVDARPAGWSRSSTRSRLAAPTPGRGGHLHCVGGGQPGGGAVLEVGVRRLVGQHRRSPVGEDAGRVVDHAGSGTRWITSTPRRCGKSRPSWDGGWSPSSGWTCPGLCWT